MDNKPHNPQTLTQLPAPIEHQFEIPALRYVNFVSWKITVEHFAKPQGVDAYLFHAPTSPSDSSTAVIQTTKYTKEQLLVLSTLFPEIIQQCTDSELNGPIHNLYNKIRIKSTTANPEHTPDNLRGKAREISLNPSLPITDYINKHRDLRSIMVRAAYPDIENDKTVI